MRRPLRLQDVQVFPDTTAGESADLATARSAIRDPLIEKQSSAETGRGDAARVGIHGPTRAPFGMSAARGSVHCLRRSADGYKSCWAGYGGVRCLDRSAPACTSS